MTLRRRFAVTTLLLLVVSLGLPAPAAFAQAPATAFLARSTGTVHVYDIPVPADFTAMVTCSDPARYGRFTDFCRRSTEQVDGRAVTLVQTRIGWDQNAVDRGSIAFARGGTIARDWWFTMDASTPEWPAFAARLKELAGTPTSAWKYVDLMIHIPGSAQDPVVQRPIPELTRITTAMRGFDAPTASGRHYPSVQVPTDLAGLRAQMLAYSNVGRRDPEFRRTRGAQSALDLSGETTDTWGGTQTVFKDNPALPWFTDQVPTGPLDEAAQFQAEYNASIGRATHTGPPGRVSILDRVLAFGGPSMAVVEAAGGGALGDFPLRWMASDTHFRPFFNVDGAYPEMGYGAARGSDGTWYFVAVAGKINDQRPPTPLDRVSVPITGSVGATPTPGATVTVDVPPAPVPAPSPAPTSSPAPQQDDDLALGETWDVDGDGSVLVTVTAQPEFTPSDRMTTLQEGSAPATAYRGYEVRYQNNGTTAYSLPDVVRQWSCTSGDATLPMVLDPPGQGLPAPGQLEPGAGAVFAFGCGTGADGYARVGALLGDELGNGSRFWVHRDAAAGGVVPDGGGSTPAATGAPAATGGPVASGGSAAGCANADTTYTAVRLGSPEQAAAATALRCLIDEARAASGLTPMLASPQLDSDAVAVANQQRRWYPAGRPCPGGPGTIAAEVNARSSVTATTAREAFGLLGGPAAFVDPTAMPLGTGASSDAGYGLQWNAVVVNCR